MPYTSAADQLAACLDDLEARIDPAQEAELLQQWQAFAAAGVDAPLFSPRRRRPSPAGPMWPAHVPVNHALRDPDRMALQQYLGCSRALAEGSGLLLNVRANYGTSIIPLLFGVRPFVMDDALDTLPTSWPLNDVAAIERLVAAGPPPLDRGYMPQVLAMAQRYRAIAASHPRIGAHVFIYHPDLQGPMDIVEVLWGSSLFIALHDRPALVHALLELVTETYIRALEAWCAIAPLRPDGNAHWGLYHRGSIMLRDDSAMNLSPAMFAEFVQPYDQRLLDRFGGGAIHFCGRGCHFVPLVAQMRGVHAVNLSQPECNDMAQVLAHTVERGINLIGLNGEAAAALLAAGHDLRGRVHAHAPASA
mgnify:FL=1